MQVVLVGIPGDTGSVEIQDLLVTVAGPTAGAVLMEWNIAQDKQGSAAMWGKLILLYYRINVEQH